jgi:hypothetical protein
MFHRKPKSPARFAGAKSISGEKMHDKFRPVSRGIATLAALTMMGTLPAQAQQTEVEQLRALIGDLQARLSKLEETQSTAAAAAKTAPKSVSAKGSPVTVSGLFQVHALGYFDQQGPGAKTANTFRLRRSDIRLTSQITSRLVGTVQIDPAKSINLNGAGTAVNQQGTLLQELQLIYQLKKTPTSTHYLDVGQYKIPIGYEGDMLSAAAIQNVERALIFTQRDPFTGGYGDIRETGIRLRGNVSEFGYDLGVFNGFGDRQNALATTDEKALIGRLTYKPKALKDALLLGVSGGTGSPSGASRDIINAFGVYKKDKWTLQSEYLDGKTQGPLGAPPVATTRKIKGYYGHVGYLFTPKLEGTFRYDYFNTDKTIANADGNDITLGANYYLKGNNAKIQVNLVRRDGSPAAKTGAGANDLRNDRYELRTNFQVGF